MLNLVKKDLLIMNKVLYLMMIMVLLVSTTFAASAGDTAIPSSILFTSMTLIGAVTVMNTLYQEDTAFPKASAMMLAIGYSRKELVLERYLLSYLLYVIFLGFYAIVSIFIKQLGRLDLDGFVISFFVYTLINSLFIGLTVKYGIKASQYIFLCIIMLISLGPTLLKSVTDALNISIRLDFLMGHSSAALLISLFIIALIALSVSILSSIKVYSKKEF